MSEDNETAGPDELEILKGRARMMGIEFSNNIRVDTLRERIAAKLAEGEAKTETVEVVAGPNPLEVVAPVVTAVAEQPAAQVTPTSPEAPPVSPVVSLRQQLVAEATKLVRVRITNMDPKKRDLHGEVLTVANEFIGTIRKFVPFGEQTDDGYHIPQCIFDMMSEKKFLDIRTPKDPKTGLPKVVTRWVREFALEVLPPLTPEELAQLAQAQLAAGGADDGDTFAE